MHNYKELSVWEKSVSLATEVYKSTRKFPKEELYGITSQIRRCAVSISSNIAEGAGRKSKKEFSRFLCIANGSAYELETQLIIAFKLSYLSKKEYDNLIISITEIQKMLYSLIKRID